MCVGIEIACDLDREALLVEVRGRQVLGAVTRRLRAAARGSERSASGAGRRSTARGSLRLGRLAVPESEFDQAFSSAGVDRAGVGRAVCGNGGQGPRVGQHLQG